MALAVAACDGTGLVLELFRRFFLQVFVFEMVFEVRCVSSIVFLSTVICFVRFEWN